MKEKEMKKRKEKKRDTHVPNDLCFSYYLPT